MPSFGYILFVLFLALTLWLPILLVITLATPRQLLDKYFKPPHFNGGELIVFGSFPGFLMRTSLFCRLYLTPKAVKGRNLEGFVEDSPKWYRLSVLVIVLGAIAHTLFVIGCMAALYLWDMWVL